MMKSAAHPVTALENRRLTAVRRGWLHGCELYLSRAESLPVRTGVYERELRHRFESMAAAADLFIDIGAGEGFFSSYLVRMTQAEVIAFEADDDSFEVLRQNLGCNASTDEQLTLRGDHHLADGSGVIQLDQEIGSDSRAVMLKIDAEGDELALLRGATRLLDREDTSVLIRLHGKRNLTACMHLLDEHGFSVEMVSPAWWRPFVPDQSFDQESRWLIAEKHAFEVLPS